MTIIIIEIRDILYMKQTVDITESTHTMWLLLSYLQQTQVKSSSFFVFVEHEQLISLHSKVVIFENVTKNNWRSKKKKKL